jgi:hypothetical protein
MTMLPNPTGDPARAGLLKDAALGSRDRRGLVVFHYRHAY